MNGTSCEKRGFPISHWEIRTNQAVCRDTRTQESVLKIGKNLERFRRIRPNGAPLKDHQTRSRHGLSHDFASTGKMLYAAITALLVLTVHADSEVFLERGVNGYVRGPALSEQGLTRKDIDAFYWYHNDLQGQLLVSYFFGNVSAKDVGRGDFDMDANYSLVIVNVSDASEGTYWYKAKQKNKAPLEGQVRVKVKVTPEQTSPSISGCRPTSDRSRECQVTLDYETTSHRLTCHIGNAKPAASIRWQRLLDGQSTTIPHDPSIVHHNVLPEKLPGIDWFKVNNTFNTSASITVNRYNGDVQWYRCEAYGDALGDQSGSHVITATVKFLPPEEDNLVSAVPDVTPVPQTVYALLVPLVVVIPALLLGLLYAKRNGRGPFASHQRGQRGVWNRSISLQVLLTVDRLQRVLREQFKSKMHEISTGLFSDQGDTRHTDDIFIELELIHDDHRRVVLTSKEEMMQQVGDRNRNHFVLQGKAGYGKSTLVRRLGYDWGNNANYLSRFAVVFLLKLKDVAVGQGFLAAVLEQNLPGEWMGTDVADVARIVQDCHSSGLQVLIILDGLDEIGAKVLESTVAEGDYTIQDVLAGRSLPWCQVLVTTRPHRLSDLLGYSTDDIYTVIQTTGFTEANRNEYIRRRFENDEPGRQRLIQQIETRAFLKSLAKIPIMLKLLCFLSKERESIPARITKLYDEAIELMLYYWAVDKRRISVEEAKRLWNPKRQENLGKVAYRGLMETGGERLVFSRNEFSKETLSLGFELGFFSESTKEERCVTFTHKSFQEYYAAYYFVRQSDRYIRRQLRSQVDIDTVEGLEYLLRFSCGLSPTAACLIFDHVSRIKDGLISDRYLRVQHLTLMLYYESESERLGAGVGSRLSLTYEEEFEALQYYVVDRRPAADVQDDHWSDSLPRVSLDRLEVYLHVIKDQSKVSDILGFVDVKELYFGLQVGGEFQDDLAGLADTLSQMPFKPARTIVCVNQKEPGDHPPAVDGGGPHAATIQALVDLCGRISPFISGFGLRVECDILNSSESLEVIASALGEIKAAYFGVLGNRLSGRIACLEPILPHVQYIELYDCGLGSPDLPALVQLLEGGRPTRLRELYIAGAQFNCVDALLRALSECPQLLMLELHNVGLEQQLVQERVLHFFPKMVPVDGNVEGQFWLRGRRSRQPDVIIAINDNEDAPFIPPQSP